MKREKKEEKLKKDRGLTDAVENLSGLTPGQIWHEVILICENHARIKTSMGGGKNTWSFRYSSLSECVWGGLRHRTINLALLNKNAQKEGQLGAGNQLNINWGRRPVEYYRRQVSINPWSIYIYIYIYIYI